MSAGNLTEANVINAVKTALTARGDLPNTDFKTTGGTQAKAIYENAVSKARTQYLAVLLSAQKTVLASGDLKEANAVQDEINDISGKAPGSTGSSINSLGAAANSTGAEELPANALIVEVLIDGPSELRVQKESLYWINELNAKPGHHSGKKEPTYLNGAAWLPEWGDPGSRGTDKSKPYPLPVRLDQGRLDFKLISVSTKRGDTGIETRDPIKARGVGSDYSVLIPDKQSGAKWYKFAIFPKGSR